VRPCVAVNTGNYTAAFTLSFVSEFILDIRGGNNFRTRCVRISRIFREDSREIIRNFFRKGCTLGNEGKPPTLSFSFRLTQRITSGNGFPCAHAGSEHRRGLVIAMARFSLYALCYRERLFRAVWGKNAVWRSSLRLHTRRKLLPDDSVAPPSLFLFESCHDRRPILERQHSL